MGRETGFSYCSIKDGNMDLELTPDVPLIRRAARKMSGERSLISMSLQSDGMM